MSDQPTIDQVAQALRAWRFRYASEDELQRGIHAALTQAGIPCRREVSLDFENRVDLLAGTIAVEAKINGTADSAARQIQRYLDSGKIDGVVLVTARASHALIEGPRVRVVSLVEAVLL